MSKRADFYYLQLVGAGELDEAFEWLETADRSLSVDLDLSVGDAVPAVGAIDGGIVWGLAASLVGGGSTTLRLATGVAYDSLGRRVYQDQATLNVDLSRTGATGIGVGGVPTGTGSYDTSVAAGNERWISTFLRFDRALSEARTDGAGATVYFHAAESFVVEVRAGDEAAAGAGALPPLLAGAVLVADVRRTPTGLDLLNAHPTSGNRHHDWIVREAAADYPVRTLRRGTAREALTDLLRFYNLHVRRDASTADYHYAKNVEVEADAAAQWISGEVFGAAAPSSGAAGANLTGGLQGAIRRLVTQLASVAVGTSGGNRIGTEGYIATRPVGAFVEDVVLSAGSVRDQLVELADEVARRVRVLGDQIPGNLYPDSTAANRQLGLIGQRWDGFFETLSTDFLAVESSVTKNLLPQASGLLLGSGTNRWNGFFGDLSAQNLAAVNVTSSLNPVGVGQDLGVSAGNRWRAYLDVLNVAVGASAGVTSDLVPTDPGGGAQRVLGSVTDAARRWDVHARDIKVGGHVNPAVSGASDLGADLTNRWRTLRAQRVSAGPVTNVEWPNTSFVLGAHTNAADVLHCFGRQANQLPTAIRSNGQLTRRHRHLVETFPWRAGPLAFTLEANGAYVDERAAALRRQFIMYPQAAHAPSVTADGLQLTDIAAGGPLFQTSQMYYMAPGGRLYTRFSVTPAATPIKFVFGLSQNLGGVGVLTPANLKAAVEAGTATGVSAFVYYDQAGDRRAYVHRDAVYHFVDFPPDPGDLHEGSFHDLEVLVTAMTYANFQVPSIYEQPRAVEVAFPEAFTTGAYDTFFATSGVGAVYRFVHIEVGGAGYR